MKLLLTIYCCMLYTTSFAQHEETDKVKQHLILQADGQDSIPHKNKKDNSIDIPTIKSDSQIIQTTPIRRLSGKGLAPMPGTDSLEVHDTIPDKISPPKVLIRRAPEK